MSWSESKWVKAFVGCCLSLPSIAITVILLESTEWATSFDHGLWIYRRLSLILFFATLIVVRVFKPSTKRIVVIGGLTLLVLFGALRIRTNQIKNCMTLVESDFMAGESCREKNRLSASLLTPHKQTFLHLAARAGRADDAKRFIDLGVNPDWQDDQQKTAAQVAMESGHPEITAMIVATAHSTSSTVSGSR